MRASFLRVACALAACAAFATSASAQYVQDNTNIPLEASSTENVDFGDVDLDGDWDAVFADGGDDGNDQNRIWVNMGGLQGQTVGDFQDRTAALFPVLSDDSRDIEFVDFDADGDLDLYTSNTAQISNQGNRWWTNLGGEQGGTLGVYADETGARWVGLNSANSSVPDSLLIPNAANPETFIDWSCDCDFGDIDNDGDMDLFHSSYGGAFGGNVPSRIYLNDGDGFFEEFNPSGFKLSGTNIQNGNPGIWAEGVMQHNTADSTGAQCDIATSTLDIDLGDVDGDLDLDILHGSRLEVTRFFTNRLEENGGAPGDLGFRDTTTATYPPNWSSDDFNYEQEFGDIDNDQDLDIYGLNWNGFTDVYMFNDGNGVFGNKTNLPSSGADDNEGDFVDYDNDGDLDLLVANFSGSNKLYKNQFVETGSVDYVIQQTGLGGGTSLDADICDYDNDGDYDFILAQDDMSPNEAFLNTTGIPDTHAPVLDKLEAVVGGAADTTNEVVRVQVYDNAAYYITWYNPTAVDPTVDGFELPSIPMVSSGGQIFRAELPGNLVGTVEYSARSEDEYGNSGVSASQSYTNTGNTGTLQGGQTSTPVGFPTLQSLTEPHAGMPLHLVAGNASAGATAVWLFSLSDIPGGLPLGDGAVLNVGVPFLVDPILTVADAGGNTMISSSSTSPALSGMSLHTQVLFLDGTGGDTWASTQSLELAFP